MKAEETQIGGNHYVNKTVQPWQAMEAWMGGASLFTAVLGIILGV